MKREVPRGEEGVGERGGGSEGESEGEERRVAEARREGEEWMGLGVELFGSAEEDEVEEEEGEGEGKQVTKM